MCDPQKISIKDFTYDLPAKKIAMHPLPERDASRLLIYKHGRITEDVYSNIARYLTADSLLIFNNTKVINARLRFRKTNGTLIEIFCLEPFEDNGGYINNMKKTGTAKWRCFIGGASKWKGEELTRNFGIHFSELKVNLITKQADSWVVEFSWFPGHLSFAEVIEQAGDIPLPPYIKRDTDAVDEQRYQTIYATHEGSVAAPTAGLHFTEKIFEQLKTKEIATDFITLHVGAGTFRPVKAMLMKDHEMHAEWIDVSIDTIKKILAKKENVIAIGTTSARTIETLYWIGVKAFLNPELQHLALGQWDVYESLLATSNVTIGEALSALINWIKAQKQISIFTQTQLLIAPGYRFKIIKAIVTNFHQPQSTLLLLVAAATQGKWQMIYDYALEKDFRFLSYGDGNLLFI